MIPIIEITRDFKEDDLPKFISRPILESKAVIDSVHKIVEDVRKKRDLALLKYTQQFDGVRLTRDTLRVKPAEMEEAYAQIKNETFLSAIRLAKKNISFYHRKKPLKSWFISRDGVILGRIVRPISRVGIYVPGGRAAYPSTLLMNAIPAQLAGVGEIAVCVPPDKTGRINPYTLVAAAETGLTEIYKVGGAQAIAALAYGTETIRKVDKISGPGNIYVTLAKKIVLGDVGIDMLAGPSEIVILADNNARASFVAADMLAQAEHDPQASAILITNSQELAESVQTELTSQISASKRRQIIRQAIKKQGKIFLVDSLNSGIRLVNLIAPEHLEIVWANPNRWLNKITSAGAIFVGSYTPEAVGDYIAGPNHTLPTSGTARFSSALSVEDFVKKSSFISYTREGLKKVAHSTATIAQAEGLDAHARSVLIRVEE